MNSPANAGDMGSIPESSRSPGVGNDNLPGEFHRLRSLEGYRQWGHEESDTIERVRARAHTRTHTLSDTHEDTVSGSFLEVSCTI